MTNQDPNTNERHDSAPTGLDDASGAGPVVVIGFVFDSRYRLSGPNVETL